MLAVLELPGTTETIERTEAGVETSTDADVIEELWEVPGVGRIPARREPEEDASSPLLSSPLPDPLLWAPSQSCSISPSLRPPSSLV